MIISVPMAYKTLAEFFIEKMGDRRLSDVSKGTGIGDSFLSKLRSGKYKSVGLEVAVDLANYFHEPLEDMLKLIGKGHYFPKLKKALSVEIETREPRIIESFPDADTHAEFHNLQAGDEFIPIRILADPAGLGQGRLVSAEETRGYALIYKAALSRKAWNQPRKAEKIVCLFAAGDSMKPTIQDGSLIAVDIEDNAEIRKGQIYVVEIPDEGVTIKRVVRSDSSLVLLADNLETPGFPRCVPLSSASNPVRGRVVWTWSVFR